MGHRGSLGLMVMALGWETEGHGFKRWLEHLTNICLWIATKDPANITGQIKACL